MKSFGIGLGILLAGAALGAELYALKLFTELAGSFGKAFGQTPTPIAEPSIWERLIPVYPYICIGIMAFAVVWYWIVEPILYFRRRKNRG